MIYKVLGMVATLDGKIVPLETPGAEPWYEIDPKWHGMGSMLTNGDKYCWKVSPGNFRTLHNSKWIRLVHNAIKRYNKEICK